MASDTRANPSALKRFNQATVTYVIPALLLVLNLMDSYRATEFNIAAGAYLLFSSLYDNQADNPAPESPEPKKTGLEKDKATNVRLYQFPF
jgi:hypothetical protein